MNEPDLALYMILKALRECLPAGEVDNAIICYMEDVVEEHERNKGGDNSES